MKAYHVLKSDFTSFMGNEAPWLLGETRILEGKATICGWGYHYSPTIRAALECGTMASDMNGDCGYITTVMVSPVEQYNRGYIFAKGVSNCRKLIGYMPVRTLITKSVKPIMKYVMRPNMMRPVASVTQVMMQDFYDSAMYNTTMDAGNPIRWYYGQRVSELSLYNYLTWISTLETFVDNTDAFRSYQNKVWYEIIRRHGVKYVEVPTVHQWSVIS